VVRILDGARLEEVFFAMSKTRSPEVKELISAYITTWRSYKPPVSGRDLLAMGFEKGKFLGDTLRLIRDKGLNGEIRDFSEAAAFAIEKLEEGSTGQSNS
jgi:tRNA nucleotidyltransferase (CCA-adding enzyme)